MPRIDAVSRESLAEFEPVFKIVETVMGFVPNSLLTMGRRPALFRGFAALSGEVLGPGRVPPATKQLVAFVTSNASGCRYCQAHTSHSAERAGVSPEKLEAAFEFETSPHFDAAERAALRLARDAGVSPPAVTDAHFEALRKHFDDDEILELVSVIALFGWLNRWNDTLATELESSPLRFARERLASHGWQIGGHAR